MIIYENSMQIHQLRAGCPFLRKLNQTSTLNLRKELIDKICMSIDDTNTIIKGNSHLKIDHQRDIVDVINFNFVSHQVPTNEVTTTGSPIENLSHHIELTRESMIQKDIIPFYLTNKLSAYIIYNLSMDSIRTVTSDSLLSSTLPETFCGNKEVKMHLHVYLAAAVMNINRLYNDDKDDRSSSSFDNNSDQNPFSCCSIGIRLLLVASIYMDRLQKKQGIVLDYHYIYRMYAASIVVGLKYTEDILPSTKILSEVFGVSLKRMNRMISQFCTLIEFDLGYSLEQLRSKWCQFCKI